MPILKSDDPEVLALKGLHVYHANNSNCSMRVRWLFDEKGLPWTSHEIDLGRKENLEDWYLNINPKGLVPAIVDDGVPVTESCDILFYIEEKFPKPSFIPDDSAQAASMSDWVNLANKIHVKAIKTYTYATTGIKTKSRSDMERYAEIQPDKELVEFHQKSLEGFTKEEIETAMNMIREVFERMENRLKDHEYLIGDTMTLADIAWVPQHVLFSRIGFDFSPYPNIDAWAKRLGSRPAFKTAILDRLPEKFGTS